MNTALGQLTSTQDNLAFRRDHSLVPLSHELHAPCLEHPRLGASTVAEQDTRDHSIGEYFEICPALDRFII